MTRHRSTPLIRPRLRTLAVSGLAAGVLAAGLALPTGAAQADAAPASVSTSQVATASRTSGANLSDNPVLRRSARGYVAGEGVSSVRRIKIKKHHGARHALRAVSTGGNIRLALPRTRVTPGATMAFAADVRTSRTSTAHLTVSWFDSAGRYLSWSGGSATTTGPSTWTTLSAGLTVPAGAAVGETVVNVLNATTGTTVQITRHQVRTVATAPVTTPPKPTPTSPVTTPPKPTPTPEPTPEPTPKPTQPAPVKPMSNKVMQPALVAYGSSSAAGPYAQEGALVIAGRENFGASHMKQVSAAGGTVLVYLDAVIDNSWGRYHQLLMNASECGPAANRWPGNIKVNEWGYLSDFRPGSVIQDKLECVLEKIVAENPHVGGFFADDLGSRSWFPNLNWGGFGADNQQAYRNGAIDLSKTFRKVADRHGLVFMVNGTWSGGSLGSSGGGYPDASRSGNALADGMMAEHHTADAYWGKSYPCSGQWATMSKTTNGMPFHMAVTYNDAERRDFAATGCYAFASIQSSYDSSPVWGGFSWTGLPTKPLGAR